MHKIDAATWRMDGRVVTARELEFLVVAARESASRRARVMCCPDINDIPQMQYVCMYSDSHKGRYAYRHAAMFHVLRGSMSIAFQERDGNLISEARIDEAMPFIRIEAGVWHAPTVLSEYVLLLECHSGAWRPDYCWR